MIRKLQSGAYRLYSRKIGCVDRLSRQGQSGKHLLGLSSSQFDPSRIWGLIIV
jgi:hypothetical protein